MKASYLFLLVSLFTCNSLMVKAQNFTDTFDSNSLEWTECAYESNSGTAVIDGGFLTIKSKGENKALGAVLTAASGYATKVGENTFFETHCYAPLDVMKSFKIRTKVEIDKLASDRVVGLVFNYRDGGNFYTFSFNKEMVSFMRYKDYKVVGKIDQGVKWKDTKNTNQEWELVSDGSTITFFVDGLQMINVRYMPLDYSGVGFYTFGKQELKVDEIEFIQM